MESMRGAFIDLWGWNEVDYAVARDHDTHLYEIYNLGAGPAVDEVHNYLKEALRWHDQLF